VRLDELALVILAACGGGDQRTPAANGQPAKAPPSGAGLAGVKQTEGALGYVELIYASANELPYAELKNAAGQFVVPSLESVTQAAGGAQFAPNTDFRVSIPTRRGRIPIRSPPSAGCSSGRQ